MAISDVSGPAEHRGMAEIRPSYLLALAFLSPYSNQEEQNLPTLLGCPYQLLSGLCFVDQKYQAEKSPA